MRYRTVSKFLDSLVANRIKNAIRFSDAMLVAPQLPDAIPELTREEIAEYLRNSNLPHAYREYLLSESLKATAS